MKGAIKSMEDQTEVPADESNLPATFGIADYVPEVKSCAQADSEVKQVSFS